MDLMVLLLILLSGYIIKYLIDTINTLNTEIREIKMKCITGNKDVKFDNKLDTAATAATAAAATAASANDALIKNIAYFKDYFDDK
jgi:hypothetical protein